MESKIQQSSIQSELVALAQKLHNPVTTLKALNEALNNRSEHNQRVIVDIIDGIAENIYTSTDGESLPLIYSLYATLPSIRPLFSQAPNIKLISKGDIEWLARLEKMVFQEISKRKINLIDIAYELAVSEIQFYRNIKKFLGLTPNNYIRILKLHRAKQYLEEFEFRTISEVSHAVGFTDSHYFSKIFINQYGVSPKVLRPA